MVAYRDFYLPLAEIYPNSNTSDLGCGRGEWLELLNEAGFKTEGIDLDEGMLSYCRDLNLNVREQDVIQYLQSLDDNSVSLVSSFHLVEHIGFDNVKLLVQEALRILKPGGLLIIETPNCENIIVSTNSFHLDPTHVMPIPNQLLSFLTNYSGFKRSKVIRLQGLTDMTTPESLQLIDIFKGVGQDYGLIAQKDGPKDILNKFDNIYNKEFGSDLDMAINKFSMHLNHAFKMRDDKINELSLRLINEKNTLELKLIESHEQIKAIYSSTSWKITAPLRLLKKALIFILPSTFMQQSKNKIKPGIRKIIYFISKRPNLRRKIVFIAKKLRLYSKLKSIYYRLNVKSSPTIKRTSQQGSELLSPRANEIYTQLRKRKNNKDSMDI
ncbi:methyltransferase domain-containing protein [Yersinia canariae]|uniref:Methyltransferase domain-containing protein n=1 Tax=Yersinia canariae TaxID=2607663 RepID=A0A857F4Z4_9GAMM|nr:methyltransferase domain-containing protein [Yersinia canariae]